MIVDAPTFREALGRFASGVCVMTTVDDSGKPAGVTISAFASLSLDPPLVLFCVGKQSANLGAWLRSTHFTVNVLSEQQEALSETFASQNSDKFSGVAGGIGENGCFRIAGCVVTLECRQTATYDEGDHHIVVGLVERVSGEFETPPLIRFRGAYRRLATTAAD
jgi:flavin reductase (DIM6/NTAB) family NADH-FMN oxidoreductase RutF